MSNRIYQYRKKFAKRFSGFRSDQSGVISVESVLWLPFFLVFVALIVDTSLLFHGQTKTMRIVQDANRLASTGVLADAEAVKAQVLSRVNEFSANARVESVFGGETVTTTVRLPAGDLVAIGLIQTLANFDVAVSSRHLVES